MRLIGLLLIVTGLTGWIFWLIDVLQENKNVNVQLNSEDIFCKDSTARVRAHDNSTEVCSYASVLSLPSINHYA